MYHPGMIEPSRVFDFRVLNSESENSATISWKVSGELPYLDGHFPGKPVVPGIALIDAALHAVQIKTQQNYTLSGVKSAKFGDLIEPGTTLELRLQRKSENEWDVQFFKSEEKTEAIVKLQIQLRTLDSGVKREIIV